MASTYLFVLLLAVAHTRIDGAAVLTQEMENIFSMLEGKTRSNRLSITSDNVMKSITTPLHKAGVDLSIKIDRQASPSSDKAKNVLVNGRWQSSDLSYKIHGRPPSLSWLETRRVFYRAFRLWSRHSPLNFHEVTDVTADINIRFESRHHGDGDANAFDGPNGHLAHALPPPSGELHFDAEDFWSKRFYGKRHIVVTSKGKRMLEIRSFYSLLFTAVHEIGHVLGLHHNYDVKSVMYPLYARKNARGKLNLHADDIKAIQALYGSRNSSDSPPHKGSLDFLVTTRRKKTKPPPNPCNSFIDAAFSDDETIHFFKDRYYWTWNGRTGEFSQPQKIKEKFGLSKPRVDAATFSDFSRRTYIFSGKKYWRYHGEVLETGYPRLSSSHGIPSRPAAAFHIPDTEDIVIIKKKKMYIFDEVSETAKLDKVIYPPIDAQEHHGLKHLGIKSFSFYNNKKNSLYGAIKFNSTIHFFKQGHIFSLPSAHIAQIFSNLEFPAHSSSLTSNPQDIPWLKFCA